MTEEPTPPTKPNKAVSRVVYAVFITVAGWFIISSTVQITLAVFTPEPDGKSGSPLTPACAAGVRELATAVDRAIAAAALGRDAADATGRYRAARSPEWDDARRSELLQPCSDAHGLDAAAAVARFDRMAEGAAGHQGRELGSVRRTVDSFIR